MESSFTMDNENLIPTYSEVQIYFDQKGFNKDEANSFYRFYCLSNWVGKKGAPIKNWRTKALEWMWRLQKNNPYQRSKARMIINGKYQ